MPCKYNYNVVRCLKDMIYAFMEAGIRCYAIETRSRTFPAQFPKALSYLIKKVSLNSKAKERGNET
jgi:hypothetical protein